MTKLEKPLKRELSIILTMDLEGLKLTPKGKRKGHSWRGGTS